MIRTMLIAMIGDTLKMEQATVAGRQVLLISLGEGRAIVDPDDLIEQVQKAMEP